jgi:hypothetical protein
VRIIRKRTGFTTNSSSASEWVPPEGVGPNGEDLSAGASAIPGESGTNNLQSGTQTQISPPGAFGWNNPLFNIGFAGSLIILLFVLQEIVRRIWKKLKGSKSEVSH